MNTVLLENFQTFITLTLSLVIEGLPFVILGVLVASLVRTFVSPAVMLRLLPRWRLARRLELAVLGTFMPVCECGNVPVARSLMTQGLKAPDVTVFLLAAPIINPITVLATWNAFAMYRTVAVIRVAATIVIALGVAALLDRQKNPDRLLVPAFAAVCRRESHSDAHSRGRWAWFADSYQSEFWLILKMLCIGALIAAATQTVIPREVITALGSNIWLSLVSMLALALIVSICSGVDAFFALSYTGLFPIGSIMVFLIASPMINIKSLVLMKSTFSWLYLALVVPAVASAALTVGLLMNMAAAR